MYWPMAAASGRARSRSSHEGGRCAERCEAAAAAATSTVATARVRRIVLLGMEPIITAGPS